MRFLHVSDLHIGKPFYHQDQREFLDLQESLLEKIIETARDHDCDALVIAGDIYDRSDPSAEAVAVLDRFLNRLKTFGPTVLMIAGNHDSAKKLGYARSFLEDSGIYLETAYDGQIRQVSLEDTVFWLLPFIKPFTAGPVLGERPASYQDMMEQVLARETLDPSKTNILVSHQFITGASTCESEAVTVGGLDDISADTFSQFDYVAMGHLHSPQKIGKNVWYPGTLQRLSISELDQEKGALLVDVRDKELTVQKIAIRPDRDFRRLKGTLDELTDPAFCRGQERQDYIYASLTDLQPSPSAQPRLQEAWPHLVGLGYEALEQRWSDEARPLQAHRSEDPAENIRDFFRQQNGLDLSAGQEAIMLEVLERMRNQ